MNIKDQLVLLSELCLLDCQYKKISEKSKVLPKKSNQLRLAADKLLQEESKLFTEKQALEKEQKNLESEINLEKANLRKWQSRADKIKGERDYAALLSEISGQKRKISNLDDSLLEAMEKVENISSKFNEKSKQAKQADHLAHTEWNNIKEEVDSLNNENYKINADKEVILKQLPANLMKRYNKIIARRNGVGVAIVAKEICQSCMTKIPAELYIKICKNELIENCPTCQRFLVSDISLEPKQEENQI